MSSTHMHHVPPTGHIPGMAASAEETKSARKRPARISGAPGLLYAHALAIGQEAEARYRELAEDMADRGHASLAELFTRLANLESEQLLHWIRESIGVEIPLIETADYAWFDDGAPLAGAREFIRRMMTPRLALSLAISAAQQAGQFYTRVASEGQLADVRERARDMAFEKLRHLEWLQEALAAQPAHFEPTELSPGHPAIAQEL